MGLREKLGGKDEPCEELTKVGFEPRDVRQLCGSPQK